MKLGAVLSKIPQFNELLRGVSQGQSPFGCVGLSQIHKAHFAAGLYESLAVPAVLVAPDDPSAVRRFEDLSALLPERMCADILYAPDMWHDYRAGMACLTAERMFEAVQLVRA